MGIKSGVIMVGHIAGDPRLTTSEETGTPRFYARVGVDHWRREDDGRFTNTGRTYHDLAIRYKAAEAAMEMFKKGTTSSPPDSSRSSPIASPARNERSSGPTRSLRTR